MPLEAPVIPETITVHLGLPNETAQNVTVSFADYIKNVASSEIYPTWPDAAIRANIYAQISFALNRIYTEYYRSRGYEFDITNRTQNDQSYIYGRDIFENISQITDDIFDSYISRDGAVEPLFAQYCDGIQTTCDGLSQWGTVSLAEAGQTPLQILRNYYGDTVELITDVPIASPGETAPAVALRPGTGNDAVRQVQIRLNRIGMNYPAIPKITPTDGYFGAGTEAAVKVFQSIFNLTQDGIVGRGTWYSILRIYNSVKRLSELNSEGISLEEISRQYPEVLFEGSSGAGVRLVQYFLSYIAQFVPTVQQTEIDGSFGPSTKASVESFQRAYGLSADGIVGEVTWRELNNVYAGLIASIPTAFTEGVTVPYPGILLRVGSENDYVRLLQEYLNYIGRTYTQIPAVPATGYFGALTYNAVDAFQNLFGLPRSGEVDSATWDAVTDIYEDLYNGNQLNPGQFPGYTIS